jgi:hypothetical protein
VQIVCLASVGAALSQAYELHIVVGHPQAIDQLGQCQCHAIDFGGVGFRDDGQPQRAAVSRVVVNLQAGVVIEVHPGMMAPLRNSFMTGGFLRLKFLCHANFISDR